MGDSNPVKRMMSSNTWLIIYVVVALVFALIMVWFATSKGRKVHVNVHNGSHKLDIIDGFGEDEPIVVDMPKTAQV